MGERFDDLLALEPRRNAHHVRTVLDAFVVNLVARDADAAKDGLAVVELLDALVELEARGVVVDVAGLLEVGPGADQPRRT